MDASGRFFDLSGRMGRFGVPLLIVSLVLMAVAFVTAIVIADLLVTAPEPIVSAPFRWCSRIP